MESDLPGGATRALRQNAATLAECSDAKRIVKSAITRASRDKMLGEPRRMAFYVFCSMADYCGGRNFNGSTGLPLLRISKCSLTVSASLEPISAIF